MKYYHACVFSALTELGDLIKSWETKCNSLYVVEHPPEGKTKRVHCHFLIETESGENWFRDEGKAVLGEYMKRGNYWIATRVQKGDHAGKLIDRVQTLNYMLKGKTYVNYSKNFSKEEVEKSRLAWVDSVKNDKTEDSSSEFYVKQIVKIFDEYKTYSSYESYIESKYDNLGIPSTVSPTGMLMDNIRTQSYLLLYRRNQMAPQPMMYKQVASSAFCRVMEKWNRLSEAVHYMKNLWY